MYTITIVNDEEEDVKPVVYSEVEDSEMKAINAILDNGIDSEESDKIIEIAETGVGGCEEICSIVDDMLSEAGFETDDHEQMLDELEHLKLVEAEE